MVHFVVTSRKGLVSHAGRTASNQADGFVSGSVGSSGLFNIKKGEGNETPNYDRGVVGASAFRLHGGDQARRWRRDHSIPACDCRSG
jgi:hypothetical protein